MKKEDLKKDVIYYFEFSESSRYLGELYDNGSENLKHYLQYNTKEFRMKRTGSSMGTSHKTARLATSEEIKHYKACLKAGKYVEPTKIKSTYKQY